VEFSDVTAVNAVLNQEWEMDGRQMHVEQSAGDSGRSKFQRMYIVDALLVFFMAS